MADFQTKRQAEIRPAQERIIANSNEPTEGRVVCLDRVNHVTHEPVIGLFNKGNNTVENNGIRDFLIGADAPYRISDIRFPVFTPNKKTEEQVATKQIVVIDSTVEDIRIGAFASHYKMVESVIEHDKDFEVEGFDISIQDNSQGGDFNKYLQILEHLNTDYSWGSTKVLNLSFVNEMSFEDINTLLNKHYNVAEGFTIHKENIHEHTSVIIQLIEKESSLETPKSADYKALLKEISLLKSLIDDGVAVVIAAGNNGEGKFDLRGAMLPDIIVVGGLVGEYADPRSARNTTIDAWEQFSTDYTINETSVTLEGTSFSAPLVARRVAEMQENYKTNNIPLSVPEINKILKRERNK